MSGANLQLSYQVYSFILGLKYSVVNNLRLNPDLNHVT